MILYWVVEWTVDEGEMVFSFIVFLIFCANTQAGRFRRLVGTMTPPDDTKEAEIYVEGKRTMVEGFVRWCEKSKVGLNQIIQVKQVTEEEPTGLYEDFYIKTK